MTELRATLIPTRALLWHEGQGNIDAGHDHRTVGEILASRPHRHLLPRRRPDQHGTSPAGRPGAGPPHGTS